MTPPKHKADTTMTDDIVERVARAMKPELFAGRSDDEVGPVTKYERDFARKMARAALEASHHAELVGALTKCRDKFAEYTDLHTQKLRNYKGKEPLNYAADIQFKIDRNREMAEMCDAALKISGDKAHG